MVDFVKVFTKSKEAFGWPEEADDFPEANAPKAMASSGSMTNGESEAVTRIAPLPLTSADRFVKKIFEFIMHLRCSVGKRFTSPRKIKGNVA